MTFTFAGMTKLAKYLNSTAMTDAALAAKVRCDRSMITKIRAGKATPSLRLAMAINRETGVPIEALLPGPSPKREGAQA
jgi:DNA-binding XRE family transcriptional regulator